MSKAWWIAVLRLTGLLFLTGMAASRLGLVLHELGGHGGFALAFGGEITDLKLFWFGGGWIGYSIDEPTAATLVAATLGGIILEAVLGAALVIGLARADARATAAARTNLAIRIARGVGAAFVGHACWYFATGTWHGYGDGLPTHRALGDARYPIAIVAGLATSAVAWWAARLVLGALATVIPGSRRARAGAVVASLGIAATLLVVPAVIEFQLRGDQRYGAIMKREGDRRADRELAAWQRERARHGAVIDPAVREAEARRLAARHREPPFMPVLALLVLASIITGAFRARVAEGAAVTKRQLTVAAALAIGSLAAVIALDIAFL
ncbi:MAG: hypothetical protein H0V17_13730 [Deltaproteobacteria bacterium]|nr:hypothetical protein [Deltaproteobacteria bacterium]